MKEALAQHLAHARHGMDFVLWAGAGYGSELGLLRGIGAGKLVLLEPHRELHERLARRVDDGDQEVLLPLALWHETGRHRFHQLNDPLRSTLLDPGRQLAGMPNLRVVAEVEVETRSLDDLLRETGCEGDGLLVLDVCGAESAIIQGASDVCLQRFAGVLLRVPDPGCPADGDTGGLLGQRGFASPGSASASRQSWIALFRVHDADIAGNDALPRGDRGPENAGALEPPHKQADGSTKVDPLLAIRERDARIAELEAELDKLSAERDAALASLQSQEQDIAKLAGERDAANAHAAQVKLRIQTMENEWTALVAERDAHIRQGAAWEGERDRANAELAEWTSRARKLEAELSDTRQALSLSVKLQSQHQADLRDLQERYRQAQSVLERQRSLLERLGERLGAASRYFHGLADQRSPDADNAGPEDIGEDPVIAVDRIPGDRQPNKKTAQRPPARKSGGKAPARPRKR